MRVGILELLKAEGRPDGIGRSYNHWIARQYASIMPQAISVWCRQRGHATFYATYYGQDRPSALLPDDLDVVFISTYTSASPLAYALAKLYRRSGTLTVIGGPHAKTFPDDCLRFFDVVVAECDEPLIGAILQDRPRGVHVTTDRALLHVPSVQERLPEIRAAAFWRGRPHPYAVVGVLASVGCPYRCDFCTDADTPYAPLPLDRLEADLRFVSQAFPTVKLAFHDPNFSVPFDAVMDTLERIAPAARVAYLMEGSLAILRGPRLQRLRDTRCWYAASGVESWADYSKKTTPGAAVPGGRKLEQVLEQFAHLSAYVPLVQANFIFGVDEDRGDAPVELTQDFIRRAPRVWPNVTIPTPFGGTPLYDRHRREKRILPTMPFAFYNAPYLVTVPKHYSPTEYYAKLIAILEHLTRPEALRARLRIREGPLAIINGIRILGIRRTLAELRAIASFLRTDASFRAFHEHRSRRLPAFYQHRLRDRLGPYAELLSADDTTPHLPPSRVVAVRSSSDSANRRAVISR